MPTALASGPALVVCATLLSCGAADPVHPGAAPPADNDPVPPSRSEPKTSSNDIVAELEQRLSVNPRSVLANTDGFVNVDLSTASMEVLCGGEAIAMQRHLESLIASTVHALRCKRQSPELVSCVQSTESPWVILTFDVLTANARLVAAMSGIPNRATPVDRRFLADVRDAVRRTRGHCPPTP